MSKLNDMVVPKVIVYKDSKCSGNLFGLFFSELNSAINISVEKKGYSRDVDYEASIVVIELDGSSGATLNRSTKDRLEDFIKRYHRIGVSFVFCIHHSVYREVQIINEIGNSILSSFPKCDGCVLMFNAKNDASTAKFAANYVVSFARKHTLTKDALKERLEMEISDLEVTIPEMRKSMEQKKTSIKRLEMEIADLEDKIPERMKLIEEKKARVKELEPKNDDLVEFVKKMSERERATFIKFVQMMKIGKSSMF